MRRRSLAKMRSETSASPHPSHREALHTELQYCAALFSEEVAHELASPLCFLETVVDGLRRGTTFEAEDLELAGEALARIRRLTSGLREVRAPRPQPTACALTPLIEAARRARDDGSVRWTSTLGAGAALVGDPVLVSRIVEALFDAALAHHEATHEVQVTTSSTPAGVTLDVIASGVGARAPRAAPLSPWSAGEGANLAFLVARRMARAHQFRLTFEASEGRILLRLWAPISEPSQAI